MTESKAQLRAEAVERLNHSWNACIRDTRQLFGSLVGGGAPTYAERNDYDALIDLLTDDCGPCYSCAKLAELRAENNALHVKLDGQECADVSQAVEDTAERVTNQGEMLDSREKLEADALVLVDNLRMYGGKYAGDAEVEIIGMLDRQAAITERHILTHPDERDEQIAELEARVNELTIALESAYAKNRSLRNHIAKMREGRHGWHVKYHELEKNNAELQTKIDELIAEIDALEYQCDLDELEGGGDDD